MTLNRLHTYLLIAVGILALLLLFTVKYQQYLQPRDISLDVLPEGASLDSAQRIEIHDTQGTRTFVKDPQKGWQQRGDGWEYQADAASVQKFFDALKTIRLGETKTARPENWAALDVRDPMTDKNSGGRRIRLFDAQNQPLLDLIIGKIIVPPRAILDGAPLDGRFYVRYANAQQTRAAQSPQPVASLQPRLAKLISLPARNTLLPSVSLPCGDLVEFFDFYNVKPRQALKNVIKKPITNTVTMLLQPAELGGSAWVAFEGLTSDSPFAYAMTAERVQACVAAGA